MLEDARRDNKRLKKCVLYFFATQREKAIMSFKQAFLKSNESSLNKKSDVLEIDITSNYINDTHGVHEVSITRKVQEGETLLGRADLHAVKKGVSNVTKKKGRGPYRKYTDQDRAQKGSTVVCLGLQLQHVSLCPPFQI